MKQTKRIIIFAIVLFIGTIILNNKAIVKAKMNNKLSLTEDEINWLEENKDKTFTLGVDPNLGSEYFKYNNEKQGYITPLMKNISEDLGIKVKIETDNWGKIFSDLESNKIDLLYGANETQERDKFMVFTDPIIKIPYVIISRKNNSIKTIGDIDKKTVGFMEKDYIIDNLPKVYKNIYYNKKTYVNQQQEINALLHNEVDAVIMSGGSVIYDYLYKYPDLDYVSKISNINSDMTFSAKKENTTLIEIINKEIEYLKNNNLSEIINSAQIKYNLKVMNLTAEEEKWLLEDGKANVGVIEDYLPFDYYDEGEFKGIDGELIKEISRMTGIKFSYTLSDFDSLSDSLRAGKIDVVNIAKTDERVSYVLYPQSFSKERNIIVGRKDEKEARDIYGLEGKTVAVINGFWQDEVLVKSLSNVKIRRTNNIQESMQLVHEGKADYLIENPTVVRYYTEELQYYDLVQRGNTSNDSFLYLGVSKNKPELAGIINKVLPMIDMDEIYQKGYEEVPHVNYDKSNKNLFILVIVLLMIIIIIILFIVKLIGALIGAKTEKELLQQREYYLSIDPLTEFYNRSYFNTKFLNNTDESIYPQVLIVADINNLKIVNDTYGHYYGDTYIKIFSDALREACPNDSVIFRIGGDEFFIVINNSNEEIAVEVINKIHEISKEKRVSFDGKDIFVPTGAIGYSIRYSSEISFEDLYKAADENMYMNKRMFKKKIE
ncbi:transporter substrate-binding domain-containing protein [Clostridium paridis]|uniref:Transporter substrate-binding domain-containing protein n=1 Tax=Clostridium paridis TaxID=2803863 RepID=A0A937FFZ4_9CLOT|nr:transporter substrate-binding domain-containing protein [Clostridium paridis]MBL4930726.1 transporter substrate-binding domain-containing protein [Clostridium paridis]